ncbi:MAG: class I poly(R)-hydroxyalkanoic acid synthase, partial [Pseudomonadota bacterium]
IAPWQSTYAGMQIHKGEKTFVLGGSGHIAGVVNPQKKNKYYYYVNSENGKDSHEFLKTAKKHKGSWWPHWEKWLNKYSGRKILAANVNKNPVEVIEAAPGSYVKKSLINESNL